MAITSTAYIRTCDNIKRWVEEVDICKLEAYFQCVAIRNVETNEREYRRPLLVALKIRRPRW